MFRGAGALTMASTLPVSACMPSASLLPVTNIPNNPVNRRNSLLGACQIISAYFLPAFYPR